MTPVAVLQERREFLLGRAQADEGFAAQQEENARQYRKAAAVFHEEIAEIDAAILSLQQPWKAAPVPDAEVAPSAFEEKLIVADKLFKAGKKVA
jgi:hypothetical protein